MKYHYVYIITNKINHKFYIGKHSTNNLDDGYMGSGIAINDAIQKYGIENFNKRILCFCDSSDDAFKVEEFLVTKNLINRDDCYNMVLGGRGNFIPDLNGEKNPFYGKHHSEEQKLKWSEHRKGVKPTLEARKKASEKLKGKTPWNKGKKGISEEYKQHLSDATKGNKNGMFGKHHSEETKQKIREAALRRKNKAIAL